MNILLSFSENHHNSLYISQCLISSSGKLKMTRRKMKPTHMERTLFGDASGNSLHNVVDVNDVGRVGALMGWEHAMPLLKYHTCLQDPDIHVSCWPPVYEHRGGPDPFSMSREGCRNLSQTFAIESQSFVLHTTSVITQKGIEKLGMGEGMLGGGSSAIYGPDGRKLSEDIPEGMEGILYADLEMDEILRARAFLDVCGHGSRPDMLWLGVDGREKRVLRYGVEGQDGGRSEEKACEKTVFSWMN
jgi:predicted amidohydrolase